MEKVLFFRSYFTDFAIFRQGYKDIKITNKRIIITRLGIKLLEAPISDVSLVRIGPMLLRFNRANIDIKLKNSDRKEIRHYNLDLGNLLDVLKDLNVKVERDEAAFAAQARAVEYYRKPVIKIINILIAVFFLSLFLIAYFWPNLIVNGIGRYFK